MGLEALLPSRRNKRDQEAHFVLFVRGHAVSDVPALLLVQLGSVDRDSGLAKQVNYETRVLAACERHGDLAGSLRRGAIRSHAGGLRACGETSQSVLSECRGSRINANCLVALLLDAQVSRSGREKCGTEATRTEHVYNMILDV